jgi:hypothetical protein
MYNLFKVIKNLLHQKREGKKMNTVFQINEYKENLTSPKKDSDVQTKRKGNFSNDEMKRLYELQQRSSSSDEFPLFWEEEDK